MVNKLTILGALEPFLTKPKEKLHLAQISRELKEPHPTVRLWLKTIEEKGILSKEFRGRQTLYSLNYDNPDMLNYLVIVEKNKLINKCNESIILKETINFLNTNLAENTKALIFGSFSETPKKAKDIDLLIVGKVDEKQIKQFSKHINKEIHIINVMSLNKVSKALKEEIIKKHLIIKGSEDLIRWMI